MESTDIVLQHLLDALQGNPVLSGLSILVIWALIQDFFLFRRLRRLVRGGDGKTLEGTIRTLQERVSVLEAHATKSELAFDNVDARLETCVRGISVKRFDPFGGEGGQQSFIVTLLDECGDGAVISGIHARDGVRVYAKGVKKFTSERELSTEEQDSIADAKKTLSIKNA